MDIPTKLLIVHMRFGSFEDFSTVNMDFKTIANIVGITESGVRHTIKRWFELDFDFKNALKYFESKKKVWP